MVQDEHHPPSTYHVRVSSHLRHDITSAVIAHTRLQHLIRQHTPEIANSIVLEQGKTYADAQGDVHRGLQVVESASAITSNLLGDKLEVASDMDTYSRRIPLGVTAAITPFNFPAM